jgi:SAM-dependent methyltransferase
MTLSEHARRNREFWDRTSDDYQAENGAFIDSLEPRWGGWLLPEDELRLLGDVHDRDVLELGCGAAQWSVALARRGARVVGLDNSLRQLEHARRRMEQHGVDFPLVHATAEAVPFPDASFDVVFCDHGAMTYADPYKTVPEVSRLLRPRGVFAFAVASPLVWMCWNEETEAVDEKLHRPYFDLHERETSEGSVKFQLPHGRWIHLFRANRLVVEELVEVQAPEGAATTFGSSWDAGWARRWPREDIWKLRKEG